MKRRGLTQIELVVMLLVSLVLITFSLAAVASLDNVDSRTKCAENLRRIGQAIMLYANDNTPIAQPYPRTKFDVHSADKPTAFTGADAANPFGADGPNANDVSAALYLLLRTEDITSSAFICPATGEQPYAYGGGTHTALDHSNFPSSDFLSYSYANPYASVAAMEKGYRLHQGMDPSFALAADANPGGDALTTLTVNMPAGDLRRGNSLNHGGDGQNVLYCDGHVQFQTSPLCGSNRDNIYTYGDSGVDPDTGVARPTGGIGVIGSSVGPSDSILLPVSNVSPAASTPLSASSPPAEQASAAQGTSSGGLMIVVLIVAVIAVAGVVVFLVVKNRKHNVG